MIANPDTSVFDRYINFFSTVDITEDLEESANDAIVDIKNRVSRGIASDGSVMDTRSTDKVGRYSRRYANTRAENSKGTAVRDLSLTGEMIDNLGILEKKLNYVSGGFSSKTQADKAEYNEIYMNQKAFDLSDAEQSKIVKNVNEKITERFERA